MDASRSDHQWVDWVPSDPRAHEVSDVYSEAEVQAMHTLHPVWESVVERTPDPLPTLAETESQAKWHDLREAGLAALAVFNRRGRWPEDDEF
jgi:hypothetical protein